MTKRFHAGPCFFLNGKILYAHSCFFRKHSGSLSARGTFSQFQKIPAFFWIGRFFALFECNLCNNEWILAKRPDFQPPQGRRYRIALVACDVEMVTEFMYPDPPLLGRILLHVRFEQFWDTVISSHNGTTCDFFLKTGRRKIYCVFRIQPVLPDFSLRHPRPSM